jgi:pimeloyl-ACP methyl ester carboxylesterase
MSLLAVVGGARPTGQLHVAGHSVGGKVAIDLALLAPQRAQSLTLA